jgi:hypothetical protein
MGSVTARREAGSSRGRADGQHAADAASEGTASEVTADTASPGPSIQTQPEAGRDQPGQGLPGQDQPGRDEPGRDQPGQDEPSQPADGDGVLGAGVVEADLVDDDLMPWWLADGFWPGDEAEQAGWLAGLPADVREAYERGPFTGEGEAIGAGFTHHDADGGRCGAGFAAGGANDTQLPGPALAQALRVAAGIPLTGGGRHGELGESELVGVLCGWRKLASWAQAGEAAAAHALVRRRDGQAEDPKKRYLAEHCGDEVAAALGLSAGQADRVLEVAAGLARIPEVHAALEAGQIDYARACAFVDLLAGLGDELAREIARKLLAGWCGRPGGGLTSGRLRRRLEREVFDADPDAADKRRARGRKLTRVDTWAEPSGNGVIAGRELQPADVIAIDKQLTATAEWLQSAGAEGSIRELRAGVFTALLAGRELATLLPDDFAAPEPPARPADAGLGSPPGPDWASPGAARNPQGARNADHGNEHGSAARAGDGASGVGDNIGANGSGAPDGASGSGAGRGAGLGQGAGWPRLAGTVNLTMPLATWAGLARRSGEVAGYGVADPGTCVGLAAMLGPDGRWCLTLTDEHGRAVAHGCARTGPPPGPAAIGWAAGLRGKLDYLEQGMCGHARQAAGYVPPRSLRHLVSIRQRTCSAPGCSRAASRCDLDHTLAYDKGGRTCECNLAPLCRRHHRAKQAPGWHLEQPQPGHMTWHLPHQRSYQTTSDPYPV